MTAARKQREGSLTDDEVGFIRNLLARGGYKNQDILGLVNTVRRQEGRADTNGGRISDVKTGQPRYNGIKAASDEDTDTFIARAKNPVSLQINTNPLGQSLLRTLLPAKQNDESLDITETDKIECKKSVNVHYWARDHIRPVMAFANNKGGYLVFGVEDNTWKIIGIDREKFEKMDRKGSTQTFLNHLSCAIDFDTTTIQYGNKTVGVVYISPVAATCKPVMSLNQNDHSKTSPGQIYYRYQAENNLIRPAELQRIIEERIRGLSESILTKHIQNILSNGIENSAVLNLDTGEVDGKAGNFVIDETLLPQISFVKEGEFVEKSGAPTLKLIGEIISTAKVVSTKIEPLTAQYPYSYMEMSAEIKKQLPNATPSRINAVIKSESIKNDKKYAAYNFRNNTQAANHKKTDKVPSGTPSIYNQAAVSFIVEKLQQE